MSSQGSRQPVTTSILLQSLLHHGRPLICSTRIYYCAIPPSPLLPLDHHLSTPPLNAPATSRPQVAALVPSSYPSSGRRLLTVHEPDCVLPYPLFRPPDAVWVPSCTNLHRQRTSKIPITSKGRRLLVRTSKCSSCPLDGTRRSSHCPWRSFLTWSPTDGRCPDSSSTDSDERPAAAAYIKEVPYP